MKITLALAIATVALVAPFAKAQTNDDAVSARVKEHIRNYVLSSGRNRAEAALATQYASTTADFKALTLMNEDDYFISLAMIMETNRKIYGPDYQKDHDAVIKSIKDDAAALAGMIK